MVSEAPSYLDIPAAAFDLLPTPCLVAELAAIDRNIERVASAFRAGTVRLRPHFKAHKCTELMRRQLAAGGCVGVTCATVDEAAACAAAGINDVLIANEFVDHDQIEAAVEVAKSVRLTVVVDSVVQAERLNAATDGSGSTVHVFLDVDPGLGRTGVPAGSDLLLELAAIVTASPGLELDGIQGYEGHVMLERDDDMRQLKVRQAAQELTTAQGRLEAAGFTVRVVSGGGTGTYRESAATGVFTEIQAGSYVLMDATYEQVGVPFERAFGCLASVISRRSAWTAVLNAGTKAISGEKGPPSTPYAGIRATNLADEHCRLALDETVTLSVGDRLVVLPAHVDPTLNLHSTIQVWDGTAWLTWEIDGRRRPSVPRGVSGSAEATV